MQIPLIWLYFAAGAAAGVLAATLVAYILLSRREAEHAKRLEALRAEAERRKESDMVQLRESRQQTQRLDRMLQEANITVATLQERVTQLKTLEKELERSDAELHGARERNVALEKELAELRTRLEAERKQAAVRLEELKEAREAMRKEFKVLASGIMEENSKRFGDLSKEGVEAVLKPLREQVGEFKRRLETVHTEETKSLSSLLTEIRNLREINQKIGEEAVNLTRALRGESKTRGIWGEMVLERVLEASGLREGEEYEREVSLHDAQSRRYRPDVIVHLPDDRDIVIDAKTSLVAYERYVNAETEEEKALYAKRHLAAVKSHIDRLGDKSYTQLEGLNTLDFVFMFMPIEGALTLALQSDPKLYDKAFAKRIVLVSPTTLLVALRAVENTWRHDRQNRNAMEIARRAGLLYDKFVGFAEELQKVGRQLETLQRTYAGAFSRLKEGRGNIVRQIEDLRELGARVSRQMPKELAEEATATERSEDR
ncbi:DNA recombination protein RmuC [Hydrogenimonas urashimensis]|uniref:DNA recombination protein RmuC n=1 Tax=Hydrogenimonas urashimensis TaxID=2740515 RepID=UPI001915BCC2|nr:DNA recombination protein RmuC [Hydrogenimonas urashimensis]